MKTYRGIRLIWGDHALLLNNLNIPVYINVKQNRCCYHSGLWLLHVYCIDLIERKQNSSISNKYFHLHDLPNVVYLRPVEKTLIPEAVFFVLVLSDTRCLVKDWSNRPHEPHMTGQAPYAQPVGNILPLEGYIVWNGWDVKMSKS